MRTQTKNFFKLLCFGLAFLIIFFAISDLFTVKSEEWSNFRGFYSEERDSLDVVYLGGSVCITSWVPYEAWHDSGITSYALGRSSFMSFAYKPVIKEMLRYQKPQLLIIDARPFVYSYLEGDPDEVYGTVALINCLKSYSVERVPLAEKAYSIYNEKVKSSGEGGNETFASMLFDIVRYHGNWPEFDTSYIPSLKSDLPQNYSKGFKAVQAYSKQSLNDNTGVNILTPVNSQAEADLIDLLDYLNDNEINALFVVAPYNVDSNVKSQFNYISNIIESRGYSFVDFNDLNAEMGIDGSTEFYDENHMTIFGAEKYTAYLTKYLLDNYNLKTDHSSKVESDWNNGYEIWTEQRETLEQDVAGIIAEDNKQVGNG
jgi:hypothetical protein